MARNTWAVGYNSRVLRAEPRLFGPVASAPVVSRLVTRLAADAPAALRAIGSARAAAREHAWGLVGDAAPGASGGPITVDMDVRKPPAGRTGLIASI